MTTDKISKKKNSSKQAFVGNVQSKLKLPRTRKIEEGSQSTKVRNNSSHLFKRSISLNYSTRRNKLNQGKVGVNNSMRD